MTEWQERGTQFEGRSIANRWTLGPELEVQVLPLEPETGGASGV